MPSDRCPEGPTPAPPLPLKLARAAYTLCLELDMPGVTSYVLLSEGLKRFVYFLSSVKWI